MRFCLCSGFTASHRAANPFGFCLPVSLSVALRQVRRTLLPLMDAESLRLFGKRHLTIRYRRTPRRDFTLYNGKFPFLRRTIGRVAAEVRPVTATGRRSRSRPCPLVLCEDFKQRWLEVIFEVEQCRFLSARLSDGKSVILWLCTIFLLPNR